MSKEGSADDYRRWGIFLSDIYLRNHFEANEDQILLIGDAISDDFFKILKIVASETGAGERPSIEIQKKILKILSDVTPTKKGIYDLLQNPTRENANAFFGTDMGDTEAILDMIYQDYIRPYYEAAKQVLSGIDLELKEAILETDPIEIALEFKGRVVPKEVAEQIYTLGSSASSELKMQVRWIREWVAEQPIEIAKAFLFAVTGCETLVPGERITILQGTTDELAFATCTNSITLPDMDMIEPEERKGLLLVALEASIKGSQRYNKF